jgi:tripartite-type tricarboxylate transporter receptor subunit TctC
MRKAWSQVLLPLAILGAIAPAVAAASWPSEPIILVVPFAAGGALDVVSRLVATPIGSALGGRIVVDNRAGAGGTIGLNLVSKARPDGYTLVSVSDVITILPYVYRDLTFDVQTSFTPITMLTTQPLVLAVNTALPVKTVSEFIALAKARPGALSFATSGVGTQQHLTGELIKMVAKIDMTHVPYKGGGQAIVDLAAGQVPVGILGSSTVIPQARGGKVRILAVTSARRSVALPDVPTLAESGLKGFDVSQWLALLGPPNLPQPIVERLNAQVKAMLESAELQKRLQELGFEAAPTSPQGLDSQIKQGLDRWGKLIKVQHISFDSY